MNIAPRQILLSIIALAILIRLVAAFALGDTALPVSGAYDQVSYDMLAQRVLSGHGFSFPTSWYPFTAPDEQTAHWSFLYALYLAGVYALFGHHPFAARIIQVILSGLHIWLVYRIGRRLFGEWVGVASAILTTFYAYFIFFNAALMTQTFYIIALLAALNLTLTLADDSKSRPGIWNGCDQNQLIA
jgi:4-amino-4-deoxy-L-arabinose transferase-like glycosyltransferase